jgi:putative ABC transport system permease protein
VAALAGRPAPPKRVRRSALPGLVVLAVAFGLLTYAGARPSGSSQGVAMLCVVGGFIALVAAVVLLAPMCLVLLGRLARHTPVAARLALRDLARYRARSGSALAAISLGVLIAVMISIVSAARYANVLDYAGPNLTSSQLVVYTPNGPYGEGPPGPNGLPSGLVTGHRIQVMRVAAGRMASALGTSRVTELDTTSASLQHAAPGRNWSGPVYVATPALLRSFGISPGTIRPGTDILTMRPGLSSLSKMQLVYGNYRGRPLGPASFPCRAGECLAGPVIQQVSGLPSGTSAPNTVITEQAVRRLGLSPVVSGWLIQTPHPLTAAQIKSTQLAAAGASMTVETRSSVPSLNEIIDWATVFGVLLALGVLALSVGLIRSETASDLRTLTATGASGQTRRALTAVTAGALGLLGAVLGVAAGYVAAVGYFRGDTLEGGLSALSAVPVTNLVILLIGMPLVAAVGGWLFAGREPPALGRQPIN